MSKWSKILTRTKEIGEAGSALIPIIKLALTLSGVMGLFLITNAHFEQKKIIEQYAFDVQQYESRIQTANAFVDSLRSEVIVQENETQKSLATVAQLETTVTTLTSQKEMLEERVQGLRSAIITDPVASEIIAAQDSIIDFQDEIIVTQEENITELKTIIERKDLSIYFLTQSVDSLQTVIDTRPKLPEDPKKLFGILPKPSRTATAITMFTAGVVTTLLITR